MSNSEQDMAVLGKRARNGVGEDNDDGPSEPLDKTMEESSDEDVGPMPMPASGSTSSAAKKKRKG
jgi:peptidylprolyl isomerase domain and WD repeat-containing protein 1